MKLNLLKKIFIYVAGDSILINLFADKCLEFKDGKFIGTFKLPFQLVLLGWEFFYLTYVEVYLL